MDISPVTPAPQRKSIVASDLIAVLGDSDTAYDCAYDYVNGPFRPADWPNEAVNVLRGINPKNAERVLADLQSL